MRCAKKSTGFRGSRICTGSYPANGIETRLHLTTCSPPRKCNQRDQGGRVKSNGRWLGQKPQTHIAGRRGSGQASQTPNPGSGRNHRPWTTSPRSSRSESSGSSRNSNRRCYHWYISFRRDPCDGETIQSIREQNCEAKANGKGECD